METGKEAVQWEKVHVFISSTFNDMHAERDYLVKRVFPELQAWCERRKLRLVDIDLRWGVSEQDATHNKNVVNVCLNRIDDCRPFFLCFLGQRRGWVPKDGEVSDETFTAFPDLRQVVGAASVTEMEILHALINPFHQSLAGKTKKPAEYYERAKYAFFYLRDPSYLDQLPNDPSMLRETYTNEWIENATEREAHNQALQEWREVNISDSHRPHHLYEAKWDLKAKTPELMIPLQCPSGEPANIKRWQSQWQKAGVTATGLNITDDQVEASRARAFNHRLSTGRLSDFKWEEEPLSKVIIKELQEAIAERFHGHSEVEDESELQKEIDQQEQFLFTASEGFIPREGDFTELDDYVRSDSNQLFVLTAEGGIGKSTLLANWVDRYRRRIEGRADHSIHFRFIGQSDGTTTVYSTLRLLLSEIKEVDQKFDEEIPLDPVKLRNEWPVLLEAIGKRGKTVIVIDALNQIESGLTDVGWLPRRLPDNIKLIVSFKRGDEAAEKLYERFSEAGQVRLSEVKPFEDLDDRRRLVRAYLSQYLKELDEPHLETLIRLRGAGNPLYLKVVLSELRVFGAFASLRQKIRSDFGDTPLSAFAGVLNRLESDPAYSPIDPKEAVPLLFGLLAHAQRGLSVDELTSLFIQTLPGPEDNQGWRDAITDTIYLLLRQVRPFTARREGRYDFFFSSFRLAAQQRYVAESPEDQIPKRPFKKWHGILADYFYGLPTWQAATALSETAEAAVSKQPTRRKVAELPFHLTQAEEWKRLEETLCDLGFIEAKCAAGMTYELEADYRMAIGALPEAREQAARHEEQADRVRRYTDELIAFASRAVTGKPSDQPEPPPSVYVLSNEELKARAAEITAHATPLERIRAFAQFVGTEAHHLVRSASRPFFCAQEAYNFSDSGPVAQAARSVINEADRGVTIVRSPRSLPPFNPFQAGIRSLEGHTQSVTAAILTPNGRLAVSGSEDNTLRVWDVQAGRCLRTLEGHSSPILAAALSPDGRIAVSGGGYPTPLARLRDDVHSDNTIRVWDVQTGECLRELNGHSLSVVALALTADGRLAISGSFDKTARVWDVETGQCLRTLKRVYIDNKVIDTSFEIHHKAISLSVDGRLALVASDWDALCIWDLEGDCCLRVLQAGKDGFKAVSLRPDGRRAASVGWDGKLRIWDVESAECLQTLEGHSGSINSVSLSADGCIAATGGEDQTLRIWDIDAGKCLRIFEGHSGSIKAVSLTADGRIAVSGSNDYTLQVWDVEGRTGQRIDGGHLSEVNAVRISANTRIAVSASEDQTIRVWATATGECLGVLEGHSSEVRAVALTADASRAFSGSGPSFARGAQATDNTLRIWDLGSGRCLNVMEGHSIGVSSVALSPDERIALSGSDDKTLRIWDAESGRCLHILEGHAQRIVDPTLSLDGRLAVFGSASELRVWDLETGVCVRRIEAPDTVFAVKLVADGQCAAAVVADGTLRLWDINTGRSLRHIDCGRLLAGVTLSPDGRYAVIIHEPESYITKMHSDGFVVGPEAETLQVYDIRAGRVTTRLKGHSAWVSPVRSWADERHLVTTSGDRTLRIWDVQRGECVGVAGQSQLLRAFAVGRNRIIAGDAMGNVMSFEVNNLNWGSTPANVVRLWRFGESGSSGAWDTELTVICEWCGSRFVAPDKIIDAINGISSQAALSPEHVPCLDLPEDAWDEPRLLSECPHCHQPLRFNPFIVDNRDRY